MEEIHLRIHIGQQEIQWAHQVVGRAAPLPLNPLQSSDPAALQVYGQQLYDTYLRGTLFEEVLSKSAPLILRIYDDADQHWELLHDGTAYLAFGRAFILRMSLPTLNSTPLAIERPPLRILVTTVSTSAGLQKPDADEIDTLFHRLERAHSGLIEVTVLRNPSRMRWLRIMDDAALEGKPFHLWHYSGGQVDTNTLQLADTTFTYDQINALLGGQKVLRGIVLDIRGTHIMPDVSRLLTVPFVMLPRFPLPDETAALFFTYFYESLMTQNLAAAVSYARQKVYTYSAGDSYQTAAMTVYSRAIDQDIFARAQSANESEQPVIRDQVFVSYSHHDKAWCEQLMDYLEPLRQNHMVKSWVDSDIEVGSRWFDEIQRSLSQAKVAVLLASPAFFRSKFIQTHELPYILEQRSRGTCTVIWVAVSAYTYKYTPLAAIQAAHPPQEPLDRLATTAAEDVLLKVVRLVVAALKEN